MKDTAILCAKCIQRTANEQHVRTENNHANHLSSIIKQLSLTAPRVTSILYFIFHSPSSPLLQPFFICFHSVISSNTLQAASDMADYQQQTQPYLQQQQFQPTENQRSYYHDDGPSTSKILAVAALLPVGGTLLALAGLSFVGTLIGLAIAAPLFLIFSPILVPAALVIAGSVAGFLTSGAFGITGLSSLSWIINYLRGGRGSYLSPQQQLDQAKRRAADAAGYLGQRTKDVGQKIQNKSQSQEGGGARNTQSQGSEGGTVREQETTKTQEAAKK